jgi:predicted dehydrogenase
MKRTAGFQVAAICDRDPARINAAREKHKDSVRYFSDTKDLIAAKCCDGVTVIVPHNVHAATAVPLLEAGLHVISEKPFAVTPQECDQMIAAAKKSGVVLSVYHSRHWDRDIVAMRQVIEAGIIGEVFAIEHNMCGYGRPGQWWRSSKEVSGGLLYDMGAHGFEKAFQLVPKMKRVCTGPDQFHDEPCNRKARLTGHFVKRLWFDTTSEDHARATVLFDSGIELTVTQSAIMTAGKPCWIVSGTEGSLVLKDYCGPEMELKKVVNGQVRTAAVPTADKGTDWQLFYRNYMEHLQSGVPLVITPGLAKAAIQCIHGCEQASKEGRVVEVEFEF